MMDAYADLADRVHRLPWGQYGVPAPLAGYIPPTALRHHRDGGMARTAFQLLAALGLSGWSMRYDLMTAVNHRQGLQLDSAAYKQGWRLLSDRGLLHAHRARFGGRTAILVWLTDLGRTLLEQSGVPTVPAEWEQITERHRRADAGEQPEHTAAICVFLHHARRRGYATAACPSGDFGGAEPDARIERGGRPIYVEIQRRGGVRWQRVRKWQNQLALQGFCAICAETPGLAQLLAREAQQLANVPAGLLADLATLATAAPPGLWTHCWRSLHAPLEAARDAGLDAAALFTGSAVHGGRN